MSYLKPFLLLCFLLVQIHFTAGAQEKVRFEATVLGFDNKPLPLAHVHLEQRDSPSERNRKYKLQI